jgi:putative endonuclease
MGCRNKSGNDNFWELCETWEMGNRLSNEERIYAVYILASKCNGTLYIGVTGDLPTRITQHKSGEYKGFTQTYKVHTLVWFESFGDIGLAIQREKTMKKWPRQWKINVIERDNPQWKDLYPQIL